MSRRPELHREVDFRRQSRVAGEAGGHVEDESASGGEQLAEADEDLATPVSRRGGEDVESDDTVKSLRRARKCVDGVGKAIVRDVCLEEMNLPILVTSRVDNEALLVERPRNVRADESLDSIDRNAEVSPDLLLRTCDEATATSTELKDSLARLKVGQLECGVAVGTMGVVDVFVAADHFRKGGVDLGGGIKVDHGDGEVGGGVDWGTPLLAKKVECDDAEGAEGKLTASSVC
jgi:hypothetical protein